MPIKKSAAAKLHTKNRGTSIFDRENISTNTTVPLPSIANKNTTQTPHRNVHQSNKSWHGKNGPGDGKHWTEPGVMSELNGRVGAAAASSSKYSSTYAGKLPGYVKSWPNESHNSFIWLPNFLLKLSA